MVAKHNLIKSFDITGEEFREVNLPDCFARKSIFNLPMSKLRESVLVLERGVEDNNPVIYVWMMQDDVPKTFTKLFSVNSNTPDALLVYVRGFRKTGEPIIEIVKKVFGTGELAVYEPYSKHIHNYGIIGSYFSFIVSSYMETLLLIDQPDPK
ncbi:hypothetical protein Hanom_Chr15g01410271 [Helianthus anomalus]